MRRPEGALSAHEAHLDVRILLILASVELEPLFLDEEQHSMSYQPLLDRGEHLVRGWWRWWRRGGGGGGPRGGGGEVLEAARA